MANGKHIRKQTDIKSADGKMLACVQEEHASINDSIMPSPSDLKEFAEIDPRIPEFFMELSRKSKR